MLIYQLHVGRTCLNRSHLFNVLPDGRLASALADLCDVCAREAVRELREELEVYIGGDGTLAEHGTEDLTTGAVIWGHNKQ